jgi:cytochrome c556
MPQAVAGHVGRAHHWAARLAQTFSPLTQEDAMLRSIAVAAAVAIGATAVYAQNAAVIKERRETMRTIAKSSGATFKIVKGEAPFNLATVQDTLKKVQSEAPKLKNQFPDDSKTGGNTEAQPLIWAKRAEFNAAIDKWVADAKTAEGLIKDEASFKAEYPKVSAGCGGCHKASDGFAPALSESFKNMQKPL